MKKPFPQIMLVGLALIGLVAIAVLIGYATWNESRHTAVNPYILLAFFIPLIVVGIYFSATHNNYQINKQYGIVLTIIGLVALLLLVYFDKTNTLLQYEVWTKRGMPEKGQH